MAAPLCTSNCKTYISDTVSEGCAPQNEFILSEKNLAPVLHRTNVVIHHSHGVPARQETRHNTTFNEDSCSFSRASVWTYTIHIPVMEKAERLTGRTIQAVIGLVRSWRCPKHGSIQGLQTGDTTGGKGTGKQAGVWGSITHRETHWGRHERRNKEGVATTCLLHRTFNTEQRRLKRKS